MRGHLASPRKRGGARTRRPRPRLSTASNVRGGRAWRPTKPSVRVEGGVADGARAGVWMALSRGDGSFSANASVGLGAMRYPACVGSMSWAGGVALAQDERAALGCGGQDEHGGAKDGFVARGVRMDPDRGAHGCLRAASSLASAAEWLRADGMASSLPKKSPIRTNSKSPQASTSRSRAQFGRVRLSGQSSGRGEARLRHARRGRTRPQALRAAMSGRGALGPSIRLDKASRSPLRAAPSSVAHAWW
ncbi:uncharacterized protein BXZ73DRAFT_79447 [Epithele typhae]|uniref:uncharacterized protein n=1 Tax=Epithele typhae TaxID=378194 RepID=UPI0020075183|nr:uncharacterized protein BXZ73DRAFT_79447 [Epithele typhae]KAH9923762.1 hypothetical protein BXZ73DRAFT_79447 [Epithele typhae]